MLFSSAASIALVAFASNVAAEPKPYRLVSAPVLGLSLARRDTNGYQPEQTVCGDGTTCAEACGDGYETCPSNDDSTHCFNPANAQICCSDGSGNSCDDGYYCSHDTVANTWCCPESMNLVECAAAYNVDGALVSDSAYASSAEPTTTSTTSAEPTTTSTTEVEYTTPEVTSTPEPTSTVVPTTKKTVKTTEVEETTTSCTTPGAYTTAWVGSNTTVTSAGSTHVYATPSSSGSGSGGSSSSSAEVPAVTTGVNGAATTGASALLIVAAGFFALL
ncbi:hypothetical protein B0J13DRAFT_326255 [Dactylonectria estremocensis]|uniref:Uncharacterized protein n=1 Tax=Dactylonectria estremocensis TaxID=1079267 RepID=A0A9P9EUY9_9HYPO|nr:hypothetical protein B0J13DRAFT_326255 [Dactylonectria estremocensis]